MLMDTDARRLDNINISLESALPTATKESYEVVDRRAFEEVLRLDNVGNLCGKVQRLEKRVLKTLIEKGVLKLVKHEHIPNEKSDITSCNHSSNSKKVHTSLDRQALKTLCNNSGPVERLESTASKSLYLEKLRPRTPTNQLIEKPVGLTFLDDMAPKIGKGRKTGNGGSMEENVGNTELQVVDRVKKKHSGVEHQEEHGDPKGASRTCKNLGLLHDRQKYKKKMASGHHRHTIPHDVKCPLKRKAHCKVSSAGYQKSSKNYARCISYPLSGREKKKLPNTRSSASSSPERLTNMATPSSSSDESDISVTQWKKRNQNVTSKFRRIIPTIDSDSSDDEKVSQPAKSPELPGLARSSIIENKLLLVQPDVRVDDNRKDEITCSLNSLTSKYKAVKSSSIAAEKGELVNASSTSCNAERQGKAGTKVETTSVGCKVSPKRHCHRQTHKNVSKFTRRTVILSDSESDSKSVACLEGSSEKPKEVLFRSFIENELSSSNIVADGQKTVMEPPITDAVAKANSEEESRNIPNPKQLRYADFTKTPSKTVSLHVTQTGAGPSSFNANLKISENSPIEMKIAQVCLQRVDLLKSWQGISRNNIVDENQLTTKQKTVKENRQATEKSDELKWDDIEKKKTKVKGHHKYKQIKPNSEHKPGRCEEVSENISGSKESELTTAQVCDDEEPVLKTCNQKIANDNDREKINPVVKNSNNNHELGEFLASGENKNVGLNKNQGNYVDNNKKDSELKLESIVEPNNKMLNLETTVEHETKLSRQKSYDKHSIQNKNKITPTKPKHSKQEKETKIGKSDSKKVNLVGRVLPGKGTGDKLCCAVGNTSGDEAVHLSTSISPNVAKATSTNMSLDETKGLFTNKSTETKRFSKDKPSDEPKLSSTGKSLDKMQLFSTGKSFGETKCSSTNKPLAEIKRFSTSKSFNKKHWPANKTTCSPTSKSFAQAKVLCTSKSSEVTVSTSTPSIESKGLLVSKKKLGSKVESSANVSSISATYPKDRGETQGVAHTVSFVPNSTTSEFGNRIFALLDSFDSNSEDYSCEPLNSYSDKDVEIWSDTLMSLNFMDGDPASSQSTLTAAERLRLKENVLISAMESVRRKLQGLGLNFDDLLKYINVDDMWRKAQENPGSKLEIECFNNSVKFKCFK